ncbi:hypothetical protein DPMN_037141 [Dreissena polymorpha]|uniref:Myb/SANT-like DNA-binding domain-containing protein n=1 Tax=Dreissena polymorpha TaxID=45954 RepID=A0A9D4RPI8_DREPO|nr:hypothetical protein DPMN_037141 [Dreissena polymorpha]
MWEEVEIVFNSTSVGPRRTLAELEKKWENLTAKHRVLYNDHQRLLSMTGTSF